MSACNPEDAKKGLMGTGSTWFTLAKKAYQRSLKDPGEAWVTIILSASCIESFLNDAMELLDFLSTMEVEVAVPERTKAFASMLKSLESQNAPTQFKVEIAYFILTGEQVDKGAQPFQDFSLLFRLRNELIHKKPEYYSRDNRSLHPLVAQLVSRKVIPRPKVSELKHWPYFLDDPEVARWAYNVAVRVVLWIKNAAPEEAVLAWGLGSLKEIPKPRTSAH